MRKSQAKLLKAGDRVLWSKGDAPHVGGAVLKKKYNTVWIRWDDGIERTHYADSMDHVYTAEQLEAIEQEKRMAARIDEINREKLKRPLV